MSIVLDAGALIAIERHDRRVRAMLEIAQHKDVPVCTSGPVVAQVWRDGRRQANLARALAGIEVRPLDAESGKRVGELLKKDNSSDVVDAHLALLVRPGGKVLTSDSDEIGSLLRARDIKADVVPV